MKRLEGALERFSNKCPHHRGPAQAASLVVCSKYKEMYGKILKSLTIVKLYRGTSQLKVEINVNLPQLLCIVVSVALKCELSDLVGFALTVTIRYKKKTRVESSFSTAPARSRFSPRN